MTFVFRRRLALARFSSRPVGRLINGRMSGAPDGMSIHTDDQAAILYDTPDSLRYLMDMYKVISGYMHLRLTSIFSAHMVALILRSRGAGLCTRVPSAYTCYQIRTHSFRSGHFMFVSDFGMDAHMQDIERCVIMKTSLM